MALHSTENTKLSSFYYLGDLPPADIPYLETNQLRQRKSSSLSRRLTLSQAVRSSLQSSATKQNLFQKKRRLEKRIEKCKSDYERGDGRRGD